MKNLKIFEFISGKNFNIYFCIKELKLLTKITHILFIFYIIYPNFTIAIEQEKPLDFSGNSPLFLSKNQILEDLKETQKILEEIYVLYPVLKKSGIEFGSILKKMSERILKNKTPILTHHFQKELIKTLDLTKDPNLRADLLLNKRHYILRVEPKVAFFTGIKLAKRKTRFRVIPSSGVAEKIINFWLKNCSSNNEVLFPILPERHSENLFMIGAHSNHQLKPLECKFENDSGNIKKIKLPLFLREAKVSQSRMPIYEYDDFRIPYLRWYRDGKSDEIEVKKFFKLARRLRNSRTLIVDVRGNKFGSFNFIEKWLKEYTRNHWKNVIVKERQTIPILTGLLNRVQWNMFNSKKKSLLGIDQLEKKRFQLKALINHFKDKKISEKWVETKFFFNGKKTSPKWSTKLIVIANQNCGNGCQFLAALTKQIKNGILIGTNTGPFPKNISGPIFQLKNSKIILSLSHIMHLDHTRDVVSPLGYLPDYWLFPPTDIKEIQKFASKIN